VRPRCAASSAVTSCGSSKPSAANPLRRRCPGEYGQSILFLRPSTRSRTVSSPSLLR
jgi:hypothetical protein